jgi:uncharacterized GH25 family protein
VRRIAFCVALLVFAATLRAHDFWIEPSTFVPVAGATVAVRLRSGENLEGRPAVRASKWIERFVVRQDGRDQPIDGIEGSDPAGWLIASGTTPAVIAYRSRPTMITLAAARFTTYLREHGLERIIELRAKRGDTTKPGRELFSRCAKAQLRGVVREPVGLRYEIVAEAQSATAFRGRVLFEGKPLAGALVVAQSKRNLAAPLSVRSDANGAFSFTLDQRGLWLIKSVHMVEAPAKSGADWESLWASLTFEA